MLRILWVCIFIYHIGSVFCLRVKNVPTRMLYGCGRREREFIRHSASVNVYRITAGNEQRWISVHAIYLINKFKFKDKPREGRL